MIILSNVYYVDAKVCLPYSKDVEILTKNILSKEDVEHNSKLDYCKTRVEGKYMYRWWEFKIRIPQETEERREAHIVIQYKGLKGKASIPTDDLIPLVRRCRNHHSMAYQILIANTDIYKCSSHTPHTTVLGN